jgi:hypothetical protein
MQATYAGLLAHITGRAPVGPPPPDAGALVRGDDRAGADERVQIYAHMYRARLTEALGSQFPRLARWLGPQRFAELALAHLSEHPSRHFSLRFIGQRLPDWLERRRCDPGREDDPRLADLAALEWARADVFDAADQAPLTLDHLRAFPQERFAELPLRLIGAHRMITARAPLSDLWDALACDAGEDDASGAAATPAIATTGASGASCPEAPIAERLLIWRQGVSVFHRSLEPAEASALASAAHGTTFGAVCDGLVDTGPPEQAAGRAFVWLSTWIADDLLTAREDG